MQASALHRAGRLDEAEKAYRQMLRDDPANGRTLQLLGVLLAQRGRDEEAIVLLRRSVQLAPQLPEYKLNLAAIVGRSGRHAEAAEVLQAALRQKPDYAEGHNNLGVALEHLDRLDEAAAAYERAVALRPDYAEAFFNLGNALRKAGRYAKAESAYARALELQPAYPAALEGAAIAATDRGDAAAAIGCFRRAVEQGPGNAGTLSALLYTMHYDPACGAEELFAEHRKWGERFCDAGISHEGARSEEGGEGGKRAEGDEGSTDAGPVFLNDMQRAGGLLHEGNARIAHEEHEGALSEEGRDGAWDGRGMDKPTAQRSGASDRSRGAAGSRGEITDPCVTVRESIPSAQDILGSAALRPQLEGRGNGAVPGGAMSDTSKAPHISGDLHAGASGAGGHGLFEGPNAAPPRIGSAGNGSDRNPGSAPDPGRRGVAPDPPFNVPRAASPGVEGTREVGHCSLGHPAGNYAGGKRLRVGYVSPDFREHTPPRFLAGALMHHDPEAFEVFCYSDVRESDHVTAALRRMGPAANWPDGPAWRETAGLDDAAMAAMVRADRIDILVDLRGHGSGNRLKLFARRAAPVQVNMIGYFNTTGLPTMDWRITDERQDPPGQSEQLHTEQLARLPGGCWCYVPGDAFGDRSPPVLPPPALGEGRVTFGSLNKIVKISVPCAQMWARVVLAVPGSRLLLPAAGETADFIRRRMKEAGLPEDRLALVGKARGRDGYLRRFNEIDISLDPWPFNGITTTCDSLWMGVPVVSLAGGTTVSRAGRSILHSAGLADLAVDTPEAYVRRSAELAADLSALRQLRLGMRAQLSGSYLMDQRRFAAELGAAFSRMWRERGG